jgi:hypothetical protein
VGCRWWSSAQLRKIFHFNTATKTGDTALVSPVFVAGDDYLKKDTAFLS